MIVNDTYMNRVFKKLNYMLKPFHMEKKQWII